MNNWFLNNREVIRNLYVNTGTTDAPVWSNFCTTSEVELTLDAEMKDFFVYCDSIKRSVLTGFNLKLNANIVIDMNNEAIKSMLGDLHTLIENGEVAQLNNVLIQFELIEGVNAEQLTYKKYQVPVIMQLTKIGGPAEDEGRYDIEMVFNGKGTVVTA